MCFFIRLVVQHVVINQNGKIYLSLSPSVYIVPPG